MYIADKLAPAGLRQKKNVFLTSSSFCFFAVLFTAIIHSYTWTFLEDKTAVCNMQM